MRSMTGLGEVENVDHGEQGGVQRVKHKMGVVPAAVLDLQTRHTRHILVQNFTTKATP